MRQQTIALFLDHGEAFTTQRFQFWPVQHRNLPTVVFDHAKPLQPAGGFPYPFTAYAEHVGDQFLRHGQLVGRQAIERQQQPAAQLLRRR